MKNYGLMSKLYHPFLYGWYETIWLIGSKRVESMQIWMKKKRVAR